MSKPIRVREEALPVFCQHTLPVHPTNAGADVHQEWPEVASGIRAMPMAGRFVVVNDNGYQECENGFLLVDDAGQPYWQASVP